MSGLDKSLLQVLVEFLGPFQIATKELEASKTLTIHAVHSTHIGLLLNFQVRTEDNSDMTNLFQIEKNLLKEKFFMIKFHVMGELLGQVQTNKLRASMCSKSGKSVAADLWTLSIDESLED